jgi:hypothetical protein
VAHRRPLTETLGEPGFNPRKSDASQLFALLEGSHQELALGAERALARLGEWAALEAMGRVAGAAPPLRGRLCRLVGRIARATGTATLQDFLRERLVDTDPKTRRNAIIALGKLTGPGIEEALLETWTREAEVEHRRSVATALGKAGGLRALDLLRHVETSDAELRRILDEAILKIERTQLRLEPTHLDSSRRAPRPLPIVFHCRAGIDHLLAAEISEDLQPRPAGPGRVQATLSGPLARLFDSRLMLRFTFPLPPEPVGKDGDAIQAIVRALVSPEALSIFRTWTVGTIRYRLEWRAAGHRRAATWRCATAVSRRTAELLNDPTDSPWEAVVTEKRNPGEHRVEVELWPRGLDDPRFTYRRRQVPAASHPTLAAALIRLSDAEPKDVVWDPFVGSGTELIERALAGPYRHLIGSDTDPAAVEAARVNLQAAKVQRSGLTVSDARLFEPAARVTRIITNPPMGRRVLEHRELGPLYDAFLVHASRILAPSGRLAWISPLPGRTADAARRAGLSVTFRGAVDMGGFTAEMQVFKKPPP